MFWLIRAELSGKHVGANENSQPGPGMTAPQLALHSHTGDGCMWIRTGSTFCCATSGVKVQAAGVAPRGGVGAQGESCTLHFVDGGSFDVNGGYGNAFTIHRGPNKLPSAYVTDMNDTGYAILDHILLDEDISALTKAVEVAREEQYKGKEGTFDDRVDLANMICKTPIMSKVAVHPVAMWVMQQYMRVPFLHHCHPPSMTVLKVMYHQTITTTFSSTPT
jgi:hypothetical protein